MKSVSDAFKLRLARDKVLVAREVAYKRRLWNQTSKAYDWEDDWTILPQTEVQQVSSITAALDSDQLNEFKVSNLTLTVKDPRNKWREDNPFGRFARDSGSPNFPYNPYWTKFRVRVGVELADGTTEYATMFTGLATEFTFQSGDMLQITVEGLESLLIGANAEDVSTTVTEENAGSGNAVTVDFTTANPGVGIIDEVSLNGILKVAGTDYDVSQLDDPTLGAKITFSSAPGMGVVVRITYRFWQQNKRIEELVASLLTAAGVDGADQNVDPVLFSAPILNAVVIDAQSDWQAGTPTAIDYLSVPGSIKIDIMDATNHETLDTFADGDYTANPVWSPDGSLVWSVTGGKLQYVKAGVTKRGVIATSPNAAQIGEWSFVWIPPVMSLDHMNFAFIANSKISSTTFPFEPYNFGGNRIEFNVDTPGNQTLKLFLNNVEVGSTVPAFVAGVSTTITIRRFSNGFTQVFVAGNLTLQGQSPDVVTPLGLGIGSGFGAFSSTQQFDDFTRPKATFNAVWSSPTYDINIGVISIGRLIADYSIGGGTVLFETRTSANGSVWDAWTPIAANGQVQSTVRRFLQVRVTFTHDASSYVEPIVNSIRVEYQTAVATVTLAKFTGTTVYDAIKSLGQFCNYEWGFTQDEMFFFRSKSGSVVPLATLDRSDVKSISGLVSGWDRVYSRVEVEYGQFRAVVQAPGDNPMDPKSRFNDRPFTVSVTDIIIGNDADVAHGVSKLFFAELAKPRRRFKAQCRFLPEVELSDVLRISFDQNRPRKTWYMGDGSVALGDTDISLWGDGEQLIGDMLVKVIGARNDLQTTLSEFDFQEVLP